MACWSLIRAPTGSATNCSGWIAAAEKLGSLDGLDQCTSRSGSRLTKSVSWSAATIPDRNIDLWLSDVTGGNATRFTFDPANDQFPVWSPDGSRIVWASNREGALSPLSKSRQRRRGRTRCCSSQITSNFPPTGRATGASSSTAKSIRRRNMMCGSCLLRHETASEAFPLSSDGGQRSCGDALSRWAVAGLRLG